jgi:hypothetical protein
MAHARGHFRNPGLTAMRGQFGDTAPQIHDSALRDPSRGVPPGRGWYRVLVRGVRLRLRPPAKLRCPAGASELTGRAAMHFRNRFAGGSAEACGFAGNHRERWCGRGAWDRMSPESFGSYTRATHLLEIPASLASTSRDHEWFMERAAPSPRVRSAHLDPCMLTFALLRG